PRPTTVRPRHRPPPTAHQPRSRRDPPHPPPPIALPTFVCYPFIDGPLLFFKKKSNREQHNIKAIRDKGTPFLCEAMEPDNWSPEQGRINKISAKHLKDRQKSSIFEVLPDRVCLARQW